MRGKIIASLNGTYTLLSDAVTYNVLPRGLFKFKKEHLLVGDDVIVDDTNFMVLSIEERKNELIRPKCSNIDQLYIVMSVKEPDLSTELLYKFLTYGKMNNIQTDVIFTKIDLLTDQTDLNDLINDLDKLNIHSYKIGRNIVDDKEKLLSSLENKVTIFMGQTGVGKSSIINKINPNFSRGIGEYSNALGRGKHKTKEVVLLPYKNGFIGDTPGFSSLDLGIYKEDLAMFFPGYNELYTECFYSNCLHQNEKDCKVKEKVNDGYLSLTSYKIYLKLLNELPYRKERYK